MSHAGASAIWVRAARPMAVAALHSVAMIGLAIVLILVLLPAALGAAGPQVSSAG